MTEDARRDDPRYGEAKASLWTVAVAALAAWVPFIFLLGIVPSSLYLAAPLEFEHRSSILQPYWIAAALALVILFGIASLRWHVAFRLLDYLFWIGVFVVVSDNLIPLQWGVMDGDGVLRQSTGWALVQAGLAVGAFAGWWYLAPSAYRGGGAAFALALLAWQILLVPPVLASAERSQVEAANVEEARERKTADPNLPNIYHVVFDAYSGPMLPFMARKVGLEPGLDGFAYFPNNLANYQVTEASGPSYLTGKLFRQGSFKSFQEEARTAGLTALLSDAGYVTTSYTPDRKKFWSHERADIVFTSDAQFRNDVTKTFALLVAVRAAPEWIRFRAHRYVSRALWSGKQRYSYYKRLSVPLADQFLADEAKRPGYGHYHYVHLLLPHAPYVWAGDCELQDLSSYAQQAECATLVMKRFVDALKAQGRYDGSVVVFHSDHGIHLDTDRDSGPKSGVRAMPPAVLDKLTLRGGYHTAPEVERRFRALLMVKAARAAGPLQVRPEITQLVDISATVLDAAGLPAIESDGASVLRNYEQRDAPAFVGVYRREANGRVIILGQNASEADLGQVVYTRRDGWTVEPDIKARHEGW